jgi:rSAM/selenodomain-associated transferase 1
MENALIIMAKAPLQGEVKTRLSEVLSHQKSAELSSCFFMDAMELAYCVQDCDILLAFSPDDEVESFPIADMDIIECIPQGRGNLGDRMERVFEKSFSSGYSKVILIGTDMPTLPFKNIQDAFTLLDEHTVVVGPSLDGGYYMLGMRSLIREIFEGIDWGTGEVLQQTTERLKKKGVQYKYLPTWYDVDTASDLNFLIAHLNILRYCAGEQLPKHTLAFLEEEGLL